MICKKCGTQVNDNEYFCPICGAPLERPIAAVNDVAAPLPFGLAIASAALSELGIIGLIFSLITRAKMKAYINAGGLLTGKAKAANIISKVALGLSIGFIAYWAFFIFIEVIYFGLILGETRFIEEIASSI